MEHVVFFTSPDSSPAFRRVAGLDEAVRVAEHLRNELGVTDASIHELRPVPVSFRPYYRVEVLAADDTAQDASQATADVPEEAIPPVPPPPLAPPEPSFETQFGGQYEGRYEGQYATPFEPLAVEPLEVRVEAADEPAQDEVAVVADVTVEPSVPDAEPALPVSPFVPPAREFEDSEHRRLGFFTR